ncbi:reverse transcriptase domain-containing protein [Tanacetum coccineum]
MEKFKTPPDFPPITVIDPDDQPTWSSTRTVAPTPSSAIEEAVMLRTFPVSLTGEAKTLMNELDEGTITSWNELRKSFISRYVSPAKFKRLLNEIHSFQQLTHETLIDTWLRMKSMLHTCYEHGLTKGTIIQIFYHGLDDPTHGILDVGEIFLFNTPNEAFKILEDKGDVKAIEEDEIKPFQTMSNPNPIMSNSPTVSPFLKNSTVHILHTNAKTFADDVLLSTYDGVGTGRITMKKNNDNGLPKEPNKEWKLNEKAGLQNEEVYHYLWHPTEITHLNRIIKQF